MTQARAQITNEVRRILVRNWIDLERITFGFFSGSIRISGELVKLRRTGYTDPGISILEILEAEIGRVEDVKHVQFELTNWKRDDSGVWRANSRRVAEEPTGGSGSTGNLKLIFGKKRRIKKKKKD